MTDVFDIRRRLLDTTRPMTGDITGELAETAVESVGGVEDVARHPLGGVGLLAEKLSQLTRTLDNERDRHGQ